MISAIAMGILVAMDRIFKLLAEQYLAGGEKPVLIPGILGLDLLKGGNSGAAFGIFSGMTGLLSVLSVITSLVLIWMILVRKTDSSISNAALVMICAGAVGNLYDRIVYQSVTDYLEFLFMDFPIFNFADVLVDTGAALLMIYILFIQKDRPFFAERKNENGNSTV